MKVLVGRHGGGGWVRRRKDAQEEGERGRGRDDERMRG